MTSSPDPQSATLFLDPAQPLCRPRRRSRRPHDARRETRPACLQRTGHPAAGGSRPTTGGARRCTASPATAATVSLRPSAWPPRGSGADRAGRLRHQRRGRAKYHATLRRYGETATTRGSPSGRPISISSATRAGAAAGNVGRDPSSPARWAGAFVRGLQGDDPALSSKSAACAKPYRPQRAGEPAPRVQRRGLGAISTRPTCPPSRSW